MKILSLDTAMAACSVAVVDTESARSLAAAFLPMERGHAEALPPMVAEVMTASGLGFSEIDRIAVTTGPGTFTGVRIGLAFARGLGLARGIAVIGIDSLSAIAANEPSLGPLLVVSDARNDEIYAASFDAGGQQIAAPYVTTAEKAGVEAAAGAIVLGTAAQAVVAASGRKDLVLSAASHLPVAAQFAAIAAGLIPGAMPSPLYLRAPDAKPQQMALRKIGELNIETADASASSILSELHNEVFDEGWSADAFTDLLRTPGAEAIIALERGEPLGFLLTRSAADEAEIIAIGTRPCVQRRGVARQLLTQHIAAFADKGLRQLFLEVAASNTAARGLYSSLGFTEAGRRKGYYQRREGKEDAIVMRRELAP